MDPTVALLTGVPGMEREFPDLSVHALVESLKSFASKCIYGVSVMSGGCDAGKLVPVPFALVFQPANV